MNKALLSGHCSPLPSRIIGFCCFSHPTNVILFTAALVNWLTNKNWSLSRHQSHVWWCLPQRQRRSYRRGEQRILKEPFKLPPNEKPWKWSQCEVMELDYHHGDWMGEGWQVPQLDQTQKCKTWCLNVEGERQRTDRNLGPWQSHSKSQDSNLAGAECELTD